MSAFFDYQFRLEQLRELVRARIPAKWWWCDFSIRTTTYNLNGEREEKDLFEAIDRLIEITIKSGKKEKKFLDLISNNVNSILDKVRQLQYMEKIIRTIELEEQTMENKVQVKRNLANLKLQLIEEFKRNNAIITITENELERTLSRIITVEEEINLEEIQGYLDEAISSFAMTEIEEDQQEKEKQETTEEESSNKDQDDKERNSESTHELL